MAGAAAGTAGAVGTRAGLAGWSGAGAMRPAREAAATG